MKTKIKYLLLISVFFTFFSCEDWLDVPPDAEISETDIFGNYTGFQGFVDQLYETIIDYTGHAIVSTHNLGGETYSNTSFHPANQAVTGNYRGLSYLNRSNFHPFNNTGIRVRSWEGIRVANIALEKLPMLAANSRTTEEELKLIEGQARFFRAFLHWELARAYGSIPYVDEVLAANFQLPRYWEYQGKKNWQALAERIDEDLAIAADFLPKEWDASRLGRITKGAALSQKAISLLYAGSPLMNEDAGNGAVYNTEYMERAAAEAWKVIQLADEGVYKLTPFADYQKMFARADGSQPMNNKEVILGKPRNNIGNGEINVFLGRTYLPSPSRTGGANQVIETPTQNFVDRFEMADGTLYKVEYDYDNDKRWNGRDPRFRNSIYVDGDEFAVGQGLEFFEGGNDRSLTPNMLIPYVVWKYWPKGAYSRPGGDASQLRFSTPHIRLAEMYLVYAEAVNVAYGPAGRVPGASLSAVEAVNVVRNRAGMPNANANGSPHASFQKLIENERAVELCFEGKWWYDLRRWKTIKDEYPNGLFTIKFDKDYTFFSREFLTDYVFEDRHYWLPFLPLDTRIYEGFPQNPGWD